ncbi:Kelch repeat-containing protein [Methylorubrum zatmanii]
MTRPLLVPFASLALLAPLPAAPPALAHEVGAWAGASSAPAERSEVAVAALDGKAYVIGDYNGATELLIYDLATDTWSKGAPFPYPVHHTMAAEQGGRIYVFGGYVNGWEATDRVWAYDAAKDTWQPRTPMPTARAAGGATPLDGTIHVVGGSGSGRGNVRSHEVYDPARDAWTRAADLPTPRDHLSVQNVEGRIVASGGRIDGDSGKNLSANQVYDPVRDAWSEAAPLPTARSGAASAVLGREVFVIGGESNRKTYDEVEAFDLPGNVWRALARLPTARHGFGAVTYKGRIYTLTGSPRPGGDKSGTVEVLDPNNAVPAR